MNSVDKLKKNLPVCAISNMWQQERRISSAMLEIKGLTIRFNLAHAGINNKDICSGETWVSRKTLTGKVYIDYCERNTKTTKETIRNIKGRFSR